MTKVTNTRLRWPAAVVLVSMLAGTVAIYVLVPEDRAQAIAAWTVVCGLVLAFLKPIVVGPALALLVVASAAGCGASAATRSAYALEQARCLANERQIIDRVSDEEEDRRDMAAERARCDAALLAIGGE